MQVVVTGIALQAVVEVAERRVAAEQDVIAVAARGHAAAVAGRQRQLVISLLAEQIVEAARAAVEEIIAGAAMDLVVAAEGKDLVIAARGEDPIVFLGAGDHVVAVRAGDDEIGVVEIVGREVVEPAELDREVVGVQPAVVIRVGHQEGIAVALDVAELGETVAAAGQRRRRCGGWR